MGLPSGTRYTKLTASSGWPKRPPVLGVDTVEPDAAAGHTAVRPTNIMGFAGIAGSIRFDARELHHLAWNVIEKEGSGALGRRS
jgi:hypothetical protein